MNPTEERKERNYLSALIPAVLVLTSLFVLSFYMKQAGMEKQIFLPQNYPIANDHMEKNKWYSIFPLWGSGFRRRSLAWADPDRQ